MVSLSWFVRNLVQSFGIVDVLNVLFYMFHSYCAYAERMLLVDVVYTPRAGRVYKGFRGCSLFALGVYAIELTDTCLVNPYY